MSKHEVEVSEDGSVVSYSETFEERIRRIDAQSGQAYEELRMTPGQARALERVQEASRQEESGD